MGSVPGSGRSPGRGNGNPLQYSCLENPMDRGAWRATVYGVSKSWMQLSTAAPPCPFFSPTNRWRNWKFKDLLEVIVIRSGAWILRVFDFNKPTQSVEDSTSWICQGLGGLQVRVFSWYMGRGDINNSNSVNKPCSKCLKCITSLNPYTNLWRRCYCNFRFIDEDTEAQRG